MLILMHLCQIQIQDIPASVNVAEQPQIHAVAQ